VRVGRAAVGAVHGRVGAVARRNLTLAPSGNGPTVVSLHRCFGGMQVCVCACVPVPCRFGPQKEFAKLTTYNIDWLVCAVVVVVDAGGCHERMVVRADGRERTAAQKLRFLCCALSTKRGAAPLQK
jgi:hypothetical protein